MTERVGDPEVTTSPIFRIKGQRSNWVYPDERLPPEYCEILRDVNISERAIAQSRYGYGKYYPTALDGGEIAVGMWQGTFANGDTKQVVVTQSKVYSVTASTIVDITGSGLTGGADDRVKFVFLKDQLIFNQSIDPPRVWNGDDTAPVTNTSALATVPFTAAVDMITHQNLLLVFGTTEGGIYYPTRVRWCNVNRQTYVVDINTWLSLDFYEIYDGGPAIVGAVDNWGWALIFKEDGLYPGKIRYQAVGEYEFILGDPEPGIGPLRGFSPIAKHALIARPEFVFGIAKEGAFIITPDFKMSILTSDDAEEWFALNASRLQYSQAFVRERDHQIRVSCSSANNSTGFDYELVWDWNSNALWIDRPENGKTCSTRIVISDVEWDWFCGKNGILYQGGRSTYTTDDGTGIDWRIKMAPNDLGYPGKTKHILNIWTLHRKRVGADQVALKVYLDEGRKGVVQDTLDFSALYQWNTGVKWNTGKKWPGARARRTDTWINRMCETVAPEWSGSQPASIEGYIVEFIPLEN